jgi:hypothetical protein
MLVARVQLKTIALMISIVLWGTILGGIVYSHLVFFPVYLGALPDSAVLVNGPYALHEERFWMLIHPLLILSLIISLAMNWKLKGRRKLIGITMILYAAAIVVTTLYFVPELGAFKNSPKLGGSPAEWLARGQRWQYLSWARGVVMFVAIVPLLLGLTKAEESPG